MRVNIHEIARKSGFSIATVSRVMNDKGPVNEITRQKILHIARELNYKPHPIARSLSRKQTDTIGVILPELVDEFFMDIIQGIEEIAHRNNRFIMISTSHSQRDMLQTSLEFMNSGRVDGVILMAPSLQKEISEFYTVSKRPVVFLNCCPALQGIISFSIDNFQGSYSVVQHLIDHGYKNIAMITGPENNTDALERQRGYEEALIKNEIVINPAHIIPGDFSIRSGYFGFTRLMNQRVKPRAIFAANDMIAFGIYEAAAHSKIQIPGDVAVVGFDDILLSRVVSPRLTTVHVPIVELGSRAMQYLLKMISGEVNGAEPHREELSTGLVIGGSCGCTSQIIQDLF
jgi:LacI family transcriptional regulator